MLPAVVDGQLRSSVRSSCFLSCSALSSLSRCALSSECVWSHVGLQKCLTISCLLCPVAQSTESYCSYFEPFACLAFKLSMLSPEPVVMVITQSVCVQWSDRGHLEIFLNVFDDGRFSVNPTSGCTCCFSIRCQLFTKWHAAIVAAECRQIQNLQYYRTVSRYEYTECRQPSHLNSGYEWGFLSCHSFILVDDCKLLQIKSFHFSHFPMSNSDLLFSQSKTL